MTKLAEKIAEVERAASKKKGGFALFALFLREDTPNKWDLVVAAPWADKREAALDFMVSEVKAHLQPEDVTDLSRIIVVEAKSAQVEAINKAINVEHGLAEVVNSEFFGMPIRHAYIITSQRDPKAKSKAGSAILRRKRRGR